MNHGILRLVFEEVLHVAGASGTGCGLDMHSITVGLNVHCFDEEIRITVAVKGLAQNLLADDDQI